MNSINLRSAEVTDAESIQELMTMLGYSLDSKEAFRRLSIIKNDQSNTVLLAEINKEVVGLIAVSWQHMLHYPAPVARITELVVKDSQKRKGVGQKLVAAAEKQAAENGCSFMEVTTAFHREDAQGFYKASGYEEASFKFQKSLES